MRPVVVIMGVDTTGVVPVGVVTVIPALVVITGALVVVPTVVSVVDAAPVVLAVVVALVVVVADGLVGSSNAPAVPEGELGRLVCLPSALLIIASSRCSCTSSARSISVTSSSPGTASNFSESSLLIIPLFSSRAILFCLSLALSISGQALNSWTCLMVLMMAAQCAPLSFLFCYSSSDMVSDSNL